MIKTLKLSKTTRKTTNYFDFGAILQNFLNRWLKIKCLKMWFSFYIYLITHYFIDKNFKESFVTYFKIKHFTFIFFQIALKFFCELTIERLIQHYSFNTCGDFCSRPNLRFGKTTLSFNIDWSGFSKINCKHSQHSVCMTQNENDPNYLNFI